LEARKMLNPVRWIIQKIAQRKAEKTMGNLLGKVDGYKVYITAVLGALVAVVGHFWGPLHLGPVDVPAVTSGEMWAAVWAAVGAVNMRHAVSKAAPPQA
jgi:hypothetical protein